MIGESYSYQGCPASNFLRRSTWPVNSRNPTSVHRCLISSYSLFFLFFFFFFLFLEELRVLHSFLQSMSINLDLDASPLSTSLLRNPFFFGALVLQPFSTEGRRAHNYSSWSLPNSSSLITVFEDRLS